MPRFRLRYQATDLELPPGEFVVGRSSACNLALDDALVSRRHAIFRITEEEVSVEDLGSRNGVLVNGERVSGAHRLRHLDRVTIGSQDMVLIEIGKARRSSPDTGEAVPCSGCGNLVQASEAFCRKCGMPSPRGGRTLAGATIELKMPIATDGQALEADDVTRQQSGLALLAGIADKALGMRRFDEAERVLGKYLLGLLDKAKAKTVGSEDLVRDSTRYALSLAEGLGKARWIDWVFEMNAATRVILTSADVERLHKLVRQTHYSDARALRSYLAVIAPNKDRMTPAEKFVLQRLEGLERVITA